MAVLVTGGAGYIGSHTCVELLENNKEVVVLDNLSNSSEEALNRVKRITGKEVKFYKGDISDIVILDTIFKKENIESCIHFAGLKSVGESVAKPLEYYQNNIAGTLILLQKLREYNVKNIIFSSSATVYGDPAFVPITEECPKGLCTNPYGWSKSMLEQILMDIYKADETWNIILLRYFNPIGAHKSGLMGENPNKIKELYIDDDKSTIAFTCHNVILADSLKKRVPEFFNFMKVEEQIQWEKRLWVMRSWGSYGNPNSGVYSYICNHYNIPFSRFSYGNTFDSICKRALDELNQMEDFEACFDYILIDESQDFSEGFFKLCEKVTRKCVYVAGDIFQDIFKDNPCCVSEGFILKISNSRVKII